MSRNQFFQSLLVLFIFFFSSAFGTYRIPTFSLQNITGLDAGQFPFQPIKFVNLVAPSPCETAPYNNDTTIISFTQPTVRVMDYIISDNSPLNIRLFILNLPRAPFVIVSYTYCVDAH